MDKNLEQSYERLFNDQYSYYQTLAMEQGGLERGCVEWLADRRQISADKKILAEVPRTLLKAQFDAGEHFFIKEHRWLQLKPLAAVNSKEQNLLTEFIAEQKRTESLDPRLFAFFNEPPPKPPQNYKEVFEAAERRLDFLEGAPPSQPSANDIDAYFCDVERDFTRVFNLHTKDKSGEGSIAKRRARQQALARAMWKYNPDLLPLYADLLRNSPRPGSDAVRHTAFLEEADCLLAPKISSPLAVAAATPAPSDRKKSRKRGRPSETNWKADKRILDGWKAGHYQNHVELADALSKPLRTVKLALDRAKKREARQKIMQTK